MQTRNTIINRKVVNGPDEIPNSEWGHHEVDVFGPGSYKCRCKQKPIDCDPTDGFEVIK